MILAVCVHAADVQDRDGAQRVLERMRGLFPRMALIWADGGYAGQLVSWVKETFHWVVEIVKKPSGGFQILPRRWVVERTFGWMGLNRRLTRDYEHLPDSSEARILICMINVMVHRLKTDANCRK